MSTKKKWFAKLAFALLVVILVASPAMAASPNSRAAAPKDPSQRLDDQGQERCQLQCA